MVTNQEFDKFMAEMPDDIRIELVKATELIDEKIDKTNKVLFKAFNSAAATQQPDLSARYKEALTQFCIQSISKADAVRELNERVDLASIEKMSENTGKIRKLNLDGLPNFNFVNLCGVFLNSPSYYKEAIFQSGVAAISALTLKMPYAVTRDIFRNEYDDPIYTNINTLFLAPAGSSKSVVFKAINKFVIKHMTQDIYMATSPSPEALRKSLATEYIEYKPNKKEGGIDELRINYNDGREVNKGWRVMWDEEVSLYWEQYKKGYMSGSVPLLCGLYSCVYAPKSNIGEKEGQMSEYRCDDPFLSLHFMTIPTSLRLFDYYMAVSSGYFPRFMLMMSDYNANLPETSGNFGKKYDNIDLLAKPEKEIPTDKNRARNRKAIDNASYIIKSMFDPIKYKNPTTGEVEKVKVTISEEAYEIIIDWEIEMRKQCRNNPHLITMRGRHMENAYKLAILLTIGNLPYYFLSRGTPLEKQFAINGEFGDIPDMDAWMETLSRFGHLSADAYRIKQITVAPETMKFALKLFDEIYLPHGLRAVDKLLSTYEEQDAEKVLEIFEKAPKITKAELLGREAGVVAGYIKMYEKESNNNSVLVELGKKHSHAMIEMVEHFSDDCDLSIISHTELWDRSRRHWERTEKILQTLVKTNSIIPCLDKVGKSTKPAQFYVYVHGNRNEVVMPQNNYIDYKFDGKYNAGVVFEKISVFEKIISQIPSTLTI